jgi:small-conductance mechanosensitive channel
MIRVEKREATHRAFASPSWNLVVVSLLLWIGGITVVRSQNPLTRSLLKEAGAAAGPTNSAATATGAGAVGETVQDRLAKVRADLAVAAGIDSANITNRPPGFSFEELSIRRSLLQRLAQLYEQQISYATELETLKNRRLELAREAKSWTGFTEPRPYSILLTDSLRESIQVERVEIASGESALSMLAQLTEEQQTSLKQAEARIRQLNELLEGTGAADTNERILQRELERLRSQVAAATVAVLDLERQIREERLAASRIRLGLLERQVVIANADATFSDADMAKVLARIDGEQRQLESELSETVRRRRAAAQALDAANEELRQIQSQTNATVAALAWAGELVEVRRAQLETADTAIAAMRFMLQAGAIARTMWEVRFASYRSSSAATIRQTESRLEQFRRRVELWRSYYRQQLDSASAQTALQEARLATLDPSSVLVPLLRERLAALRERDQLLLRVVRDIDRGDQLIQRLAEGLHDAAANLPFGGRVRNVLSDTRSFFSRLWNLELFVAQDTITVEGQQISGKRSITLGKILSAILILVVGYWVTGLLTRVMEPIFVKRFKIDANQANLIRRWLRVVLVFSLALFSLASVKIPVTVFAFAGGALAIGLGFGMQTILKNFVSGIIILFERPFRVGDVLDVGGQRGTVVGIGIRSSVLQRWDGTETLIPNSKLLEDSVTNWTYSNRKVRFTITVGVAYGSDTRRVVQLLSEIAERHGLVEKEPKPQVLFTDFADSALAFELRFWVNVIAANSAQVASDLRQMIDGTFAENGIVIAFPQRDFHLNAARPLQVQVLPIVNTAAENGAPQQLETRNAPETKDNSTPATTESTPAPKLP